MPSKVIIFVDLACLLPNQGNKALLFSLCHETHLNVWPRASEREHPPTERDGEIYITTRLSGALLCAEFIVSRRAFYCIFMAKFNSLQWWNYTHALFHGGKCAWEVQHTVWLTFPQSWSNLMAAFFKWSCGQLKWLKFCVFRRARVGYA